MSDTSDRKPFVAKLVETLFFFGPLIFAFGFIAPLTAQSVAALGLTLPFGLSPLQGGLVLASIWGGIAQIRGRWI